jgi:hypothetical protein
MGLQCFWLFMESESVPAARFANAFHTTSGDVGPAENDTGDELEDATGAESAALAGADTTEIGVEEALALLGADDDDQGDGKEAVYSPGPDVLRLIRNVWACKAGVMMERARGGVKYSPILAPVCCPNTIESPWHVIGGLVGVMTTWLLRPDRNGETACGRSFGKRPRSRVGVQPFALMLMSLMQ